MSNEHQRYERLAVGHVVGGLDEVDAAAFRSHLLDCRECRLRVSELRGIASDMAAAEREERASATRVATEVERRQRQAEAQEPQVEVQAWRAWPWVVVGTGVLLVVAVVVLVWNLALREQNRTIVGAAERMEVVLDVLASGTRLETSATTGTTGLVAVGDQEVVLDLADVRTPGPDEAVVVWLLDDRGTPLVEPSAYLPSQLPDGRLAAALPLVDGLDRVEVRHEKFPLAADARPTGLPLLTADAPPAAIPVLEPLPD